MLNWLSDIYKFITQTFDSIVRWVLSIIAAVYSFIDQEFHALERALTDVWNELYGFVLQAWHFIQQVYSILANAITVVWRDITSWVVGLWHDITNFINWVWQQVVHWVDYIINFVERLWHDLETWVIDNIWRPLERAITDAWNWITHEGYLVYYYLTHPDKLVALLGHWLWLSWVDLLKKYGKTIGRWLAHVMMSMVSDFVTILEDFISGIL